MAEQKQSRQYKVLTRPTDDEIRVIDEEGNQLGILDVRTALDLAQERGFDLVELDPHGSPPTCRLMDFGKWKYDQSKRQKTTKKVTTRRKEVKLRPKVEQHDFEVKLKRAKKFIEEGHKVMVTLIFRGREQRHPELGFDLMDRFAKALEDTAKVEKAPSREGHNRLGMILTKK